MMDLKRHLTAVQREKFATLSARVSFFNGAESALGNRDLLSPRRIYRKTPLSSRDSIAVADGIFKAMQTWRDQGYPKKTPTFYVNLWRVTLVQGS